MNGMDLAAQHQALLEHFPQEDLLPELVPYVQQHPRLGACIHHPLVVEIAYSPVLAGSVNNTYRAKVKMVAEARAEKDWHTFIWLHERGYRSGAFQQIAHHLSDEVYWDLLRDVWIDSENLFQWGEGTIRRLLLADRPGDMMTDEEREALAGMGKTITIYRGFNIAPTCYGWSWTLDEERAKWFARRFHKDLSRVAKAEVPTSKVLAYITGRGEEEIVYNPRRLPHRIEGGFV